MAGQDEHTVQRNVVGEAFAELGKLGKVTSWRDMQGTITVDVAKGSPEEAMFERFVKGPNGEPPAATRQDYDRLNEATGGKNTPTFSLERSPNDGHIILKTNQIEIEKFGPDALVQMAKGLEREATKFAPVNEQGFVPPPAEKPTENVLNLGHDTVEPRRVSREDTLRVIVDAVVPGETFKPYKIQVGGEVIDVTPGGMKPQEVIDNARGMLAVLNSADHAEFRGLTFLPSQMEKSLEAISGSTNHAEQLKLAEQFIADVTANRNNSYIGTRENVIRDMGVDSQSQDKGIKVKPPVPNLGNDMVEPEPSKPDPQALTDLLSGKTSGPAFTPVTHDRHDGKPIGVTTSGDLMYEKGIKVKPPVPNLGNDMVEPEPSKPDPQALTDLLNGKRSNAPDAGPQGEWADGKENPLLPPAQTAPQGPHFMKAPHLPDGSVAFTPVEGNNKKPAVAPAHPEDAFGKALAEQAKPKNGTSFFTDFADKTYGASPGSAAPPPFAPELEGSPAYATNKDKPELGASQPAKPAVTFAPAQIAGEQEMTRQIAQTVYNQRDQKYAAQAVDNFLEQHHVKVAGKGDGKISEAEREALGKLMLDPKLKEDIKQLASTLNFTGADISEQPKAPSSTPSAKTVTQQAAGR